MRQFACNLIELQGRGGAPVIALSAVARRSFRPDQLRQLESFGDLVEADIPTIETVGGGSVRCMIADIHLPRAHHNDLTISSTIFLASASSIIVLSR